MRLPSNINLQLFISCFVNTKKITKPVYKLVWLGSDPFFNSGPSLALK